MSIINNFILITINRVTYMTAYTIAYIKIMTPQSLRHIIHKIHLTVTNLTRHIINDNNNNENILPKPIPLLRSAANGSNCCKCNNYGGHIAHFDRRGLFYYCTECTTARNFMDGHFLFNGVIHTIYQDSDEN